MEYGVERLNSVESNVVDRQFPVELPDEWRVGRESLELECRWFAFTRFWQARCPRCMLQGIPFGGHHSPNLCH